MTTSPCTIKETCENNLCTSCSVCEALCPMQAISMTYLDGQFLPEINMQLCTECGLCTKICNGLDFLSPELTGLKTGAEYIQSFEEIIRHDSAIASYIAYSKDEQIRKKSVSGGIITTLLVELIRTKEYDEAFILQFDRFDGNPAELTPAHDIQHIKDAAGSHYIPVSVHNLIKTITRSPHKKYIIVGTSCQFAAIKKALRLKSITENNILFIGLFCHKTLNFNTLELYEKLYARNDEKLKNIFYRSKDNSGWPGDSKLVFDSGRTVYVDEDIRLKAKDYFSLHRCMYCIDKFNINADISCGDCYIQKEWDKQGLSNIIVRSNIGQRILDRYAYLFYLEPVDIEAIKESQDYYKEKRERLGYAIIMDALMHGSLPELLKRTEFQEIYTSLNRRKKLLNWGQSSSFVRIRFHLFWRRLKEKSDIVWHLQTASSILAWLTSVWIDFLCRYRKAESKGQNVVIVGGELFNKGAQAMTFTVVDMICKRMPSVQIILLSEPDFKRPISEKSRYLFDILPWNFTIKMRLLNKLNHLFMHGTYKSCEPTLDHILRTAHCIIDISGFGLSSVFGDMKSFDYMLNLAIAQKYGVPFYILPQSFGPFDYSASRKRLLLSLFNQFLPRAGCIYAREQEGFDLISQISPHNVRKANDIVLTATDSTLEYIYTHKPSLQLITLKPKAVGIIPNLNIFDRLSRKTFYSLYEQIIEHIKKQDKCVYLIPHASDDLYLCGKLKNMFYDDPDVMFVKENLNSIELTHLIKQCDFVVASRYHSIVHAYKHGVPAVVIGWAVKYQELLAQFGQERYCVDYRVQDKEHLAPYIVNVIDAMLKQAEKERKRIRESYAKLVQDHSVFDLIPQPYSERK